MEGPRSNQDGRPNVNPQSLLIDYSNTDLVGTNLSNGIIHSSKDHSSSKSVFSHGVFGSDDDSQISLSSVEVDFQPYCRFICSSL